MFHIKKLAKFFRGKGIFSQFSIIGSCNENVLIGMQEVKKGRKYEWVVNIIQLDLLNHLKNDIRKEKKKEERMKEKLDIIDINGGVQTHK